MSGDTEIGDSVPTFENLVVKRQSNDNTEKGIKYIFV